MRLTQTLLLFLAVSAGGPWSPVQAAALPELPRATVDTTIVPPSGRRINVPAGGDLQGAIDKARGGDVLLLEAGATYQGVTLPHKPDAGWITIRTSTPDPVFPAPGTRVGPQHAHLMARIVGSPAVAAAPRAHHYRLIGIAMAPRAGEFAYNLVQFGAAERGIEHQPHHLIIDRCYLRGDPTKGTRRGVALNSRAAAVIDSHLAEFKEAGADSQAIAGWNGAGPYKIANNYLEGAGENVMFGGADPVIKGLVPADIEIQGNHFAKPVSWRPTDPSFEGTRWLVKNLFELKNARRVLVSENFFERSWSGWAILFTVRNQDGAAAWSTIEDVTFTNNVVQKTGGGINILGLDDVHPSERVKRILIKDNLFGIDAARWGGRAWLFLTLRGVVDLVIEHNTAIGPGSIVFAEGEPVEGFVFRNNLIVSAHGFNGTDTEGGQSTLRRYFPGGVVVKNVFAGLSAEQVARHPKDNVYLGGIDQVGFVDPGRGDYRLAPSSRLKRGGRDGKDVGADIPGLVAAAAARQR